MKIDEFSRRYLYRNVEFQKFQNVPSSFQLNILKLPARKYQKREFWAIIFEEINGCDFDDFGDLNLIRT